MPAAAATPHRVVAVALPSVHLLDLAAPTHLFGVCGEGRYTFTVAGTEAGPVRTSTGFDLIAPAGLEALAEADTVVIPGFRAAGESSPPPALLEALRTAHDRGARLMSICTGAFVLAAAGLLDGRRATTHWFSTGRLAEDYPAIEVDPDVLYVDEGQVLTSAGVASGLDLCLHVVRRDYGASVAAEFARRTVVAPHRDGGQAQFIQRPITMGSTPDDQACDYTAPAESLDRAAGLQATRTWAMLHLGEPLSVDTLARHASVSPRTFARRFREETGTTPARWITDQRVALAQGLLERTDLSVEAVALRSGLGSAPSLREHLARRAHTTPTAYRRAFRTAGASVLP